MSHLEDLARRKLGSRGKSAEVQARKFLEKMSAAHVDFDFQRQYDARTARGRMPSQCGDYVWFYSTRHGVLEVKEVAHDVRLPKANFGESTEGTKIPKAFGKLRKRMLARGEITVLVHHSTTELWRAIDFRYFLEHQDQPSWVLEEFKTYPTVEEALYLRGLALPR